MSLAAHDGPDKMLTRCVRLLSVFYFVYLSARKGLLDSLAAAFRPTGIHSASNLAPIPE